MSYKLITKMVSAFVLAKLKYQCQQSAGIINVKVLN